MLPIFKNIKMYDTIYRKVDSYRLYPTKEQEKFLDKEFDFYYRLQKYIYKAINVRFSFYKPFNHNIPPGELRPFVLGILKRFRESKKYNFSNYLYNDHFAYVAEKVFLRFERKKIHYSDKKQPDFTINDYEKSTIKLTESSLKLVWNQAIFALNSTKINIRPKNLEFRSYKTMMLTKTQGRYYLKCIYYKRREQVEPEALACGIDVGIRTNITVVDSENNVTKFNLDRKAIDAAMDRIVKIRQFYRETLKKNGNNKNTKNAQKLLTKLTRVFERLTNVRTFQYNQIAEIICRKYQYICIEDVCIEEMYEMVNLRTQLNKYKFSAFFRALQIKAEKYNRKLIRANRYFKSSQICSKCGVVHNEMNSWKEFKGQLECECGYQVDRDVNAAKNLLDYCIRICKLNPKTFVRQERYEQLKLF